MLTHLQIKNFKAWQDTGLMELKPLTVIFGANSSGKSSLGHWLLALKQTALHSDRKRALHLGDERTPVDLGVYKDCVYGHDLELNLEFTLGWLMPEPFKAVNALNHKEVYQGKQRELSAKLHSDESLQPKIKEFSYQLRDGDGQESLFVRHGCNDNKDYVVESRPLKLVQRQTWGWGAEAPEKFYRFSDRTLSRFKNADFLAEFALETERVLENIYYLGPLRNHPRRIYSWSGDMPPDVGAQGENAIQALLAATASKRELRIKGRQFRNFDAFIAAWLKDLGVINAFSVRPVAEGRKEYEVLIQTHPGLPQVKLTDVGFGVSQVLPVLVQAFYAPANSVVWMEQPEMHLHPSVQASLADVFISAVQSYERNFSSKGTVKRNVQLIIESHSEHLLNRLQLRVAKGEIDHSDVAVYFVHRDQQGAQLTPLRLNMFGEIENWPENFFGDEMGDIAERVLAGIESKKAMERSE